MRLCASLFRRRRGPAGLRDLFRFCRNCGLYILRSGLSAFFESTSWPRSQSGKVRRSDTRPGDVRERAERAEGNDTTLTQNTPCFAV